MKKLFGALALLLCVLAWAMPQAAWAADVYYNDRLLCQTEQIYDSVDGACVPVRQLFVGLGYEVEWVEEYNAVWLHHSQHGSMRLVLNSREAMILYHFWHELPVAPYMHDGVLYAPLNLLKNEYCNYNVEWLPESRRWQITDVEQSEVKPFADLRQEDLTGITLHFGKQNSSLTVYTAELNDTEIDKLVNMLRPLAHRETAFTGEDIWFSGGTPCKFTLHYADGTNLGFGENGCFYYFFRDGEETEAYIPLDSSRQQAIKDYYYQLKEKYLATVDVNP